jgi:hypothetical protein
MQTVNTVNLHIQLTSKSGIFPVTLQGDGVAERPGKTYIKLSLLMQNYIILSLGPENVYVKLLGSSNWEHPAPGEMDLTTSLLKDVLGLLDISEVAISPVLAGSEVVNGVNCERIALGVDLPMYLARHAPQASSQIDLVASRAQAQVWIGTDDLRIHQLNIIMDIVTQGETLPVNATIVLSKFNEPVEFPNPPISRNSVSPREALSVYTRGLLLHH